MWLSKYVAKSGLCSRRKAAELIKKGKIQVNGKTVTEPNYVVAEGDTVTYKGMRLFPVDNPVYILLNKPKNVITTVRDERGRKTVLDLLSKEDRQTKLFPVGRLDRNTTGVLLLTNDGTLAHKLTHPRFEVQKVYHVKLDKPLSEADKQKIEQGVQLDDGPVEVHKIGYPDPNDKSWVGISLHSGRNRVIRRLFEALGYRVKELDRVAFADLTTAGLARGSYRKLSPREIHYLKYQL